MYEITYGLRGENGSSNEYYGRAKAFAGEVLAEMKEDLHPHVERFLEFMKNEDVPYVSALESYLELLTLGILWRIYSGDSEETGDFGRNLLLKLSELRAETPNLKPTIDFFRGILATALLSPDLYDHMEFARPSREALKNFVLWLNATGEFKEEAYRFENWISYFQAAGEKTAVEVIREAIAFAAWFEVASERALGDFTENVERYLNEIRPNRYWKEDVVFCGRRRVEYHLNMVGAEIMNEVYRESFLNTKQKLLLVPTCMRRLGEDHCRAVQDEKTRWLRCVKCQEECQVKELLDQEAELEFRTYMVPHNSDLDAQDATEGGNELGIIGVACVLNLLSGGWMLRRKGIPAQCVLLDYCGCKGHWHHEGIPTELNLERLRTLMI